MFIYRRVPRYRVWVSRRGILHYTQVQLHSRPKRDGERREERLASLSH